MTKATGTDLETRFDRWASPHEQVKMLLIDLNEMGERVKDLAKNMPDREVMRALNEASAKVTEAQKLTAEALGYAVL